jgi:hypothetical protein
MLVSHSFNINQAWAVKIWWQQGVLGLCHVAAVMFEVEALPWFLAVAELPVGASLLVALEGAVYVVGSFHGALVAVAALLVAV